MARDRQRAKQRKARRAAQNPGPAPTEPHRSDVPGELDHASGDVDEFDAALVAGAGGEPLDPDAADDDVTVRAEVDADDEAHEARAGAGGGGAGGAARGGGRGGRPRARRARGRSRSKPSARTARSTPTSSA